MPRHLSCLAHGLLPLAAIALLLPLSCFAQANSNEPIKVGIIGLDTSHVIAFTKSLNDPTDKQYVPGLRVVAGYKGGSPDVKASWSRVDGYTAELRDKWKVEIVNDIPTLCSKVDAVLLESVDGRPHLEQVKPVFAAHKPVFIDKPMAGNYRDGKEIAELGKTAGVPWFTASSLRFWDEIARLKNPEGIGHILSYDVLGPTIREPHEPSMFNYGVHAVEMLYQLMGPGCETVTMQTSGNEDVLVGKWKDGRLGVMRGFSSGLYAFSITVYGDKGVLHSEGKPEAYRALLVEIVKFFQTRVPPVDNNESLEALAFMEAGDLSVARGGVAVPLSEIMK
jgi:predicted dehydrogenase